MSYVGMTLAAVGILLFVFVWGLREGGNLKVDSCNSFGAFTHNKVAYDCKVRP